ncbi:TetR/AcrR family transcriptional regulator [Goodfellowiella coeruleoviolacea]|uniref:Transcriptional regulator, TetR family n=1 Tax=Goodfellowiella coeruleoviolacea TaxID=334858 RepID=A0AAE3GCC3_9PSEU|nr:TetR/AcrR family transcriptional regulator [Goodfellowiella coeruleoviolacea]MCP2165662.1 transcriptional regulator, TetR family [Goodfellowiella coeruleoviolacea]
MNDDIPAAGPAPRRRRNARGEGDRLRDEIISAAQRMLDELGDDEALSLRAVARAVSIAATSVYLHFPDRDALVLAVMRRCHEDLVRVGDAADAEAAERGPVAQLRARILAQAGWAREHPGLYKVLHESKVHRRLGMPFKEALVARTVTAVRRCVDAGLAPPDDPTTVAIDLRTAVNGMLSQRINEPDLPWSPAAEQIDRFLTKLVGVTLPDDG